MTQAAKKFIIVDDDPSNNALAKMALRKALGEVEIQDFLIPENALEFIRHEFTSSFNNEKVTLFLDINMPTLTGWEFLEKFEELDKAVQNQFNIYMLSSSVDPADIQRAQQNPLVLNYIEKPLNNAVLTRLFK